MARIALVDASPATAALVEAAAAGSAIVRCGASDIPADTELIIADAPRAAQARRIAAGLDPAAAPVLLLVGPDAGPERLNLESERLSLLRNPCDLVILQRKIRELLELDAGNENRGQTPISANQCLSPISENQCLSRISEAAATMLAAAARLDGAVWILGEPGTGTEAVAAAFARSWDGGREPAVWQEDVSLSAAVARLDDSGRVLWAPAVERRPMAEQRAFERFLAIEPQRRVVVTTGDDPGALAADGLLAPGLVALLSRITVRLAPLRERTGDIVALASTVALPVASALGRNGCVFSGDAQRLLETYPWPGNVTELEAVVTRSLVGRVLEAPVAEAPVAEAPIEIDTAHLLFAPVLGPGATARPEAPADAPAEAAASTRRAVVVPIASAPPPRAAKTSDETSTHAAQASETAPQAAGPRSTVEAVLAAFAHDIRNPMSTIKTFAGLQSDGGELAQLATSACEAIDGHLDLLQRYAELGTRLPDPAAIQQIDLVDVLGEAVDTAGAESALEVAARGSLRVRCDVAHARFIADSIVAECQSRASEPGTPAMADLAASRSAITIRIPIGNSAIDRLGKWLGDGEMPWRLAIAREAARRAGFDLDVRATGGDIEIEWHASSATEVSEHSPLPRTASSSARGSAAAARPKAKEQ